MHPGVAAAWRHIETHLAVFEVAARVGYDDPLSFSRQFKRQFGRSPRAWRQATLGGATAP